MNREDLVEVWAWIRARLGERTTWDGFVILGVCLLILIASPLIKWAAWAGIAYAVFTIGKAEWDKRREP